MRHGIRHEGLWVCRGARVFDGECMHEGFGLILDGNLVAAVMPIERLPVDLPTVELDGGTVLPGLIDAHVHFAAWQGPLYLAYGVTTVRDVGNDPTWILARRDEAHNHPWPRIRCVGPMLDGPKPYWGFCRPCVDEASARRAVVETASLGVNGIKLYPGLSSAWLPGMVEEARSVGLPTMMHCSDLPAALDAGVEEFFHLDGLLNALWPGHPPGWLDVWGHEAFPLTDARLPRTADRIAAAGMITTPTLFYWDFARSIRSTELPASEEMQYVPPQNLAWLHGISSQRSDPAAAGVWGRACRNAQSFLSMLVERGARILPGTDEPWGLLPPGRSLWREMELLAECRMKPEEVLRAATAGAAERLGLPDRGRIAPGSVADLVLVAGNPELRLTGLPEVAATVCNGRIYRPAELVSASMEYAQEIEKEPMGIEFAAKASR